jgi:hypothetical protein
LAIFAILVSLLPVVRDRFTLDLLASLASTNLFFGAGGLLPLPSVDGQVIWREVFHWLRSGWHSSG